MRVKARQEKSAVIVAALFDRWDKETPRRSGKSKLAEAIRCATSRRAALERFLASRRPYRDRLQHRRAGNPAIRPQAITRKKALFAGSHGGGAGLGDHRHASADREDERRRSVRLAHANSRTVRAGWPISQIDALMPWHFKAWTAQLGAYRQSGQRNRSSTHWEMRWRSSTSP